jgi:hypothetical protein
MARTVREVSPECYRVRIPEGGTNRMKGLRMTRFRLFAAVLGLGAAMGSTAAAVPASVRARVAASVVGNMGRLPSIDLTPAPEPDRMKRA